MLKIEKDLGFVILCPEFKFGGLRTTVSTIQANFDSASYICVVPGGSNEEDVKTASKICPLVQGKNTISSLINAGIKASKKNWCLIVMSGNVIRYQPVLRYNRFLASDKDVMYRVVDKVHWRWEDASIHGLLINKKALKEIGDFPDEESLQNCKLIWGAGAIEKGYNLKGLVGIKLL
jgi:hypothetical protein